MKPTSYTIKTCATGRCFNDQGWSLIDPECKTPSLIRAQYDKKQIDIKDESYGIYRFSDWLPVKRMLKNSCAPVTYRSEGLADALGLENLYITFSGYWPEKGARMYTCSFKETEAFSVCARLPEDNDRILVVASAGNTARAFAQVCSDNRIPIVLVIPQDNMNAMWFRKPLEDCVKIICTPSGTDYFDAITLAGKLCTSPDFLDEGGAKNIARRDGMSTTVLSAAHEIGRIPDAYFQAIGSGTGTIAAHEANLRLIEDGRFGSHIMKLYPSQNAPFTPMYDAWKSSSRELLPFDEDQAREMALQIDAKVLSNRKPPYSINGGLYDVLKASDGDIECVTNSEVSIAIDLFREKEGIDIHPAAAVAVYSLIKAVENGKVSSRDTIMLNITGGGERLLKSEYDCIEAKPDLVMEASSQAEYVITEVKHLFK